MKRPSFFRHGMKSGTCRPGRRIRSLVELVKTLEREPSVWWLTTNKPIPSTVVGNWQLRQIVRQVNAGMFRRVVRPQRTAFQGCPL